MTPLDRGVNMKLKPWLKTLLSILTIIIGGFLLFNLAFILVALIMGLVGLISGSNNTPSITGIVILIILLLVLSWFIFKSKLPTLIKATYLSMPLMVILMTIGISLYQQPQWIIYLIGAAIVISILLYLIFKKLSWLYFISTIYVALLALYISIAGIEI
jgi:hypothetical protein